MTQRKKIIEIKHEETINERCGKPSKLKKCLMYGTLLITTATIGGKLLYDAGFGAGEVEGYFQGKNDAQIVQKFVQPYRDSENAYFLKAWEEGVHVNFGDEETRLEQEVKECCPENMDREDFKKAIERHDTHLTTFDLGFFESAKKQKDRQSGYDKKQRYNHRGKR